MQQPVFFQKKESSSITIHLAGMSFTIPARMFVGNLVYLTDMIKNAKKISHSRTLHALQDILEQSYKLAYSDCSAQINLAGSQKENRLDVSIRHRFSSSAPDGNDRVAGL